MTKLESERWFSAQTAPVWAGSLDAITVERLRFFTAFRPTHPYPPRLLADEVPDVLDTLCTEVLQHIGTMDAFVGGSESPLQLAYFVVEYAPKSVFLASDALPSFESLGKDVQVIPDNGIRSLSQGFFWKEKGVSSIPLLKIETTLESIGPATNLSK
jgi:hypothetical protein